MLPVEVRQLDELEEFGITKIVAAIGVFDGIHLGHRKIINELIKMSEKLSADPILVTFFPHPRKILNPEKPLLFLRSPAKKRKILGELGIKAIVTVPFSLEFAKLPANDFIEKFMHPHNVKLAGICVGKRWKFGAKAQGNEQTLHDYANKCGFKFKAIEEVCWKGKKVSSTTIRKALSKGNFKSANYMLDRKYVISGHVISQENNHVMFQIDFGVLPPKGKYKAYINYDRRSLMQLSVVSKSEITTECNIQLPLNHEVSIEFTE